MARSIGLRKRLTAAIAVPALSVSAIFVLADPAHAKERSYQCSAGGDALVATVSYITNGTRWYVSWNKGKILYNGRNQNNMYMRLRGHGGDTTYWGWTSGDHIPHDEWIRRTVDRHPPKAANPYVKTHAVFDQVGDDPRCSAYWSLR